jgi:hypothetical protein
MALQNYIRDGLYKGLVGEPSNNSPLNLAITCVNDAPRAAQVSTVVVDTAVNSAAYTVTVDGIDVTYTADASATKIEIADGLAAALNSEGLISGRIKAASNGVDTVTLTARVGGEAFTLSESDANLTSATSSANAVAAPLYMGRAVKLDPSVTNADNQAVEAASAFSALAYVITPAAVNLAAYLVDVTFRGQGYKAQYTADASATVQEIVEGLQAALAGLLPAGVVATENNTTLTLTAATPGDTFTVSAGSSAAAATMTVTHNLSADTSADLGLIGVAQRDMTREMEVGSEDPFFAGNSAIPTQFSGVINVPIEAPITSLSQGVYVRVAANGALDKIGGFSPVAGTGLVLWNKAKWARQLESGLASLKLMA